MTTSPPPPTPDAPRDHRFFIGAMIGIATLLFLLTAATLYFRWATMNEPDCVILVEAAPSLRGAEITVDSIMLAAPLKDTIGKNDRFGIAFYVNPGEYEVKVTLSGEEQFKQSVSVSGARRGFRVDLTKIKPTTSPADEGAM